VADHINYSPLGVLIPFEQIKPDHLLWGCYRPSFATVVRSHLLPAGCLLQLIHGLDEGARGAKIGFLKKQ
jgi:hypothetical protein